MEPIKAYLKDIEKIALLTAEEEIELSKLAKKGDVKAEKRMIQSNLRLVVSIAKKYSYFGVPLLDLIEEGNLGLMKAVKKFNHKKGFRFSTYAAWWIKQYILRAVANQGKTVRIPVYMMELTSRWKKTIEKLSQKLGRKPTTAEIAKSMQIPVRKAQELETVMTQPTSLESPVGEDDSGTMMDLIEDTKASSASDEMSNFLRQEKITDLFKKMNKREQEILNMRFGLKDDAPHTLEEVADKFKITRERVRQIEEAALRKLRKNMTTQEMQ
ncbi:MAG: sigma-70 family RNA polymerase sigma factor [Candidatus Omnitrophica bacterium]|nr:sigma-70 family RNA polymerase sigma factor [Candidatus Omnitrophota bacterium]MDD5310956.1 sigma-70 family RNA polymerase sigma factor [Candidatus Omnitrophota bacterium]MDD5545770.1 sigma-70 family RNA polymerase sigma factor [Candidatus Omnitrophota bacterium]